MARVSYKFQMKDSEDKNLGVLELVPADKGWQIYIDGKLRYAGIAFSNADVNFKFEQLKDQRIFFETKQSLPKWLII